MIDVLEMKKKVRDTRAYLEYIADPKELEAIFGVLDKRWVTDMIALAIHLFPTHRSAALHIYGALLSELTDTSSKKQVFH